MGGKPLGHNPTIPERKSGERIGHVTVAEQRALDDALQTRARPAISPLL